MRRLLSGLGVIFIIKQNDSNDALNRHCCRNQLVNLNATNSYKRLTNQARFIILDVNVYKI